MRAPTRPDPRAHPPERERAVAPPRTVSRPAEVPLIPSAALETLREEMTDAAHDAELTLSDETLAAFEEHLGRRVPEGSVLKVRVVKSRAGLLGGFLAVLPQPAAGKPDTKAAPVRVHWVPAKRGPPIKVSAPR